MKLYKFLKSILHYCMHVMSNIDNATSTKVILQRSCWQQSIGVTFLTQKYLPLYRTWTVQDICTKPAVPPFDSPMSIVDKVSFSFENSAKI